MMTMQVTVTVEEYLQALRPFFQEANIALYERLQTYLENNVHEDISLPIGPRMMAAVKSMDPEQLEALIEDLLAISSPEYLGSIREARQDYQRGDVYTHDEVFG